MPIKRNDNSFLCIECKQAYNSSAAADLCESSHFCHHEKAKNAWVENMHIYLFCEECYSRLECFDLGSGEYKAFSTELNEIKQKSISNYNKQVDFGILFKKIKKFSIILSKKRS